MSHVEELVGHQETLRARASPLRYALAQSDGRERGLDDVAGPQVLPVLGGEVEERQQRGGVLVQGRDGLRVLGPVLDGEPLRRLACLLARLGVHDLVERGLHAWLEPFRELVEDVAELVEPVPLLTFPWPHVSHRRQKPRAPSPTATTGGRIPRRFKSRSTVFQLSALSR